MLHISDEDVKHDSTVCIEYVNNKLQYIKIYFIVREGGFSLLLKNQTRLLDSCFVVLS